MAGSSAADPDFGEAQSFADTLRDQTQGYIEKRKADAARLVSDVGDAIRDTGTSFDGLPQLKEFFDQAALGVDELAEDISRRSFSEMYDEVHAAVRRRPGLSDSGSCSGGVRSLPPRECIQASAGPTLACGGPGRRSPDA